MNMEYIRESNDEAIRNLDLHELLHSTNEEEEPDDV